MDNIQFKALVISEVDDKFVREIATNSINALPDGDVVVKVEYSSLNYKDALSVNGNKGVTRNYPHTPGIDTAGTVVESKKDSIKVGDKVIVSGYDMGMNTAGGFGEYIRVPSEWVIGLPEGLTLKETMMIGTGGFTAAMSIDRLIKTVKPGDGPIAVSGATGGVGTVSIKILSKLGYSVIAISGKTSETEFLKSIGATEVISREEFGEYNKRPLLKGQFAGAIDTVGGTVLDNIIKSINPLGVVTCCGNAASPKLDLTVFPFILKGISLIGIDSQNLPLNKRKDIWNKLATIWKLDNLSEGCEEKSLEEISDSIDLMMAGKLKGQVLLNLNK